MKKTDLIKEIENLRKDLTNLRNEFEEFRNNLPNRSVPFYPDPPVLQPFRLPPVPNIPQPRSEPQIFC